MAKEIPKGKKPSAIPKEAKGLLLLAFCLLLFISLLSFHNEEPTKNWLGLVGMGTGMGFQLPFWDLQLSDYWFFWMDGWQLLLEKRSLP